MGKLKKILKKENEDNYKSIGLESNPVISHRERLLARIEYAVFGNANIQKKEFQKIVDTKHPELKGGLTCYK